MLNYPALKHSLQQLELSDWYDAIEPVMKQRLSPQNHGDFERWNQCLDTLPDILVSHYALDQDTISLSSNNLLSDASAKALMTSLQGLQPWRKGPFDFFLVRSLIRNGVPILNGNDLKNISQAWRINRYWILVVVVATTCGAC